MMDARALSITFAFVMGCSAHAVIAPGPEDDAGATRDADVAHDAFVAHDARPDAPGANDGGREGGPLGLPCDPLAAPAFGSMELR